MTLQPLPSEFNFISFLCGISWEQSGGGRRGGVQYTVQQSSHIHADTSPPMQLVSLIHYTKTTFYRSPSASIMSIQHKYFLYARNTCTQRYIRVTTQHWYSSYMILGALLCLNLSIYACIIRLCTYHRLHGVAMATFWRTFHHDGKISPGCSEDAGARPPPFILSTITSSGVRSNYIRLQIHSPYFSSTPICTLWD